MKLIKIISCALIFLNACHIAAAALSSTNEYVRKQMQSESRKEELIKKRQEEKKETKDVKQTGIEIVNESKNVTAVKFSYISDKLLKKVLGPRKDDVELADSIKNGLPADLINYISSFLIQRKYSKKPQILKAHNSDITCLTKISEFGFASGSERGDIYVVYNTNPFKSIRLLGHKHPIETLISLSDGSLLSQASDGIIIWDLKTGKALWKYHFEKLTYFPYPIIELEKNLIAFAIGKKLCIFDRKKSKITHSFIFEYVLRNIVKLPNGNLAILCKNEWSSVLIFFNLESEEYTECGEYTTNEANLYQFKNRVAILYNFADYGPSIDIFDENGDVTNRIYNFHGNVNSIIHLLRESENGELFCLTSHSLNSIAQNNLIESGYTISPLFECDAINFYILNDGSIVTNSNQMIGIYYPPNNHHVTLFLTNSLLHNNILNIRSGQKQLLIAGTNKGEILIFNQTYDINPKNKSKTESILSKSFAENSPCIIL